MRVGSGTRAGLVQAAGLPAPVIACRSAK